jgi:uncharacterized protein (TIGR02118 family)
LAQLRFQPHQETDMAQLIVLYKKPADTAAFDAYYAATHAPLAKKIPGLRRYDISTGPVSTPGGASAYHLVAALTFDDLAALQAGLGSRKARPRRATWATSPRRVSSC